jgi:hypothetical protein
MMINPLAFADILDGLIERTAATSSTTVSLQSERHNIRAVVAAWFQYRKLFLDILGNESDLHALDKAFEGIQNLTATSVSRTKILRKLKAAQKSFKNKLWIPLSRAYWSRIPERTPTGRDTEVAARLKQLDTELANSYEQATMDLEDEGRISYRGCASEPREVLTGVLHILAPTDKVQATDWYQEARKSGQQKEKTPTRSDRTKYILRVRAKGSSATEAAEAVMLSVEERLGHVVSATYRRNSDSTHRATERDEVNQQLQYLNALLRELLPV